MSSRTPDVGQMAPDFEALKSDQSRFQLKEALRPGKNVMLLFYRGHWWPFCVSQLIELKKHYETFQKLDTQIYALSVDEPEKSQILAKETQLPFELLSDVGRKIIDLYGLHNRDERGGIAYPAEFVINGEGKICYRSLDHTVQRADVSEVIQFLEHLQKDSSYQAQGQKKKWMIPSFLPIKQMWRNLFVRKSN